jgi:hypothetical protein
MLKLTLRYIKGLFVVSGPDRPPMWFKSLAGYDRAVRPDTPDTRPQRKEPWPPGKPAGVFS